jgi:hypothetical protein
MTLGTLAPFCFVLLALVQQVGDGLWTHPRKDPANTSRSEIPGKMKQAPVERWWIGPEVRPVQSAWPLGADTLAISGSALQRLGPDGAVRWTVADAGVAGPLWPMDFGNGAYAAVASVGGGDLVQFDLRTGKRIWRWSPPPGTEQGGPILWKDGKRYRLALFPQNSVGGTVVEFDAPSRPPVQVWKQEYPGKFYPNFGPYGVVADMDNNGRPDILLAAKPAYVAAIDGDTGKILFDLRYPIPGVQEEGRPYGLIQAVDLDQDGFRDVVVASCQVEEYIGVVRNRGGKSFELAWAHFVENDLPYDNKELRPQIDSVADVDGDGRPELVLGLFNDQGDGAWRTVVLDALSGWNARKREYPGRYFWGVRDFDGDGKSELLLSEESERRTKARTRLSAVDVRAGRVLAELENAGVVPVYRRLPDDVDFRAGRSTPLWVRTSTVSGFLVSTSDGERLWNPAEATDRRLATWTISPVARMAYFSGREPVASDTNRLQRRQAARSSAAVSPLVGRYRGRPELVVARGDGSVAGGRPVPGKPGVLEGEWRVEGVCPSLWIGKDGRRLVAVFDRTADRVLVYEPVPGERAARPILTIDLPFEPYRIPGMLIPVPGDSPQYFAGMKTGVHTTACALFDSRGKLIWRDDLDGPYPRPAGIVSRGPDGTRWVVDNHGKILYYEPDGRKTVVAHGWHQTIPGRGDGAKYVLPIIGPYGAGGQSRVVLSPGLEQLEILSDAGARVAMQPYGSIYERQFAVSATARNTTGWVLGMLSNRGVFHCAGLADARELWRWDTGGKPTHATRVVSGDVDNDGKDEFLVALSDGTIAALNADAPGPSVVWRVRLDAAVREMVLGDVDGDKFAELIVETDDGRVRILGPAETRRGQRWQQ